jgi:hypothetical protein
MSHKVEPERLNHNATAGISIAAFVVVVAVSLAYYQFVYVPEANTKPTFSDSSNAISMRCRALFCL